MHAQPPLQPPRVPSRWNVTLNELRETMAPECRCGALFQAKREHANVLTALGWYPHGEPSGRCRLVVHRGDFQGEELFREEMPTREAAAQSLEDAMKRFS